MCLATGVCFLSHSLCLPAQLGTEGEARVRVGWDGEVGPAGHLAQGQQVIARAWASWWPCSRSAPRTCTGDPGERRGGDVLTCAHVTGRGSVQRALGHALSASGTPGPRGPDRRRRRRRRPSPGGRRRRTREAVAAVRGDVAAAACRPAERQSRRPRTPLCPSRRPGSPCPWAPTSCGPTRELSSAWRL